MERITSINAKLLVISAERPSWYLDAAAEPQVGKSSKRLIIKSLLVVAFGVHWEWSVSNLRPEDMQRIHSAVYFSHLEKSLGVVASRNISSFKRLDFC